MPAYCIKRDMKTVNLEGGALAMKWMDKCAVMLLTTLHDAARVHNQHWSRHAAGEVELVKPQAT